MAIQNNSTGFNLGGNGAGLILHLSSPSNQSPVSKAATVSSGENVSSPVHYGLSGTPNIDDTKLQK